MAKKKAQKKARSSAKKDDIAAELAALGKSVENAMRAAARSQTARSIPSEVMRGFQRVGDKLQTAIEEIGSSDETRDVKRRAEKIFRAGKSKGTATSRKFRTNLAAGLKAVSEELGRLAGKIDA